MEAIGRVYCPIAWLPPGHNPGPGVGMALLPSSWAVLALGHFGSTTRPLAENHRCGAAACSRSRRAHAIADHLQWSHQASTNTPRSGSGRAVWASPSDAAVAVTAVTAGTVSLRPHGAVVTAGTAGDSGCSGPGLPQRHGCRFVRGGIRSRG